MAGIDIPVPELQVVIRPPVIKDIAYMGEQKFLLAMQYLCLDKESLVQDKTLLSSLNNFQVLMKVLEHSQDKTKKEAVITLFQILFPDYVIRMNKNSIILSEGQNNILIDEKNFDYFQSVLKQVLCVNSILQGENIVYNPANKKAKEIADKLMRGRLKAAEIKGKESSNDSVLTRYISILVVGQIVTLQESLQLNLFQLFDLIERYNSYLDWNIDLQIRLAGGTPDKTAESWMRELHSNKATSMAFRKNEMSDQITVF